MSAIKILKKKLQEELALRLSAEGFVSREQRLERKKQDVTQIIHLAFIDGRAGESLSLVVNLAVRHERLEELAHAWRSDLSGKEKKSTATLGAELGKILGQPQMRWEVAATEDCAKVADNVVQLIQEHGLPYLERYSNLENVKERFSSNNPREWQQLAGGRALRLPLVHGLLGEPEMAQREFVAQYDYLRTSGDLLAGDYPAFVREACSTLEIDNPLEGGDGKV